MTIHELTESALIWLFCVSVTGLILPTVSWWGIISAGTIGFGLLHWGIRRYVGPARRLSTQEPDYGWWTF